MKIQDGWFGRIWDGSKGKRCGIDKFWGYFNDRRES